MFPRAYRLFALFLALFWVPATAHCQLEALGLEFAACADGCHEGTAGNEDRDGCTILENGNYKTATNPVKVAPTLTTLSAGFICVHRAEPSTETGPGIIPAQAGRPREWVPAWPFARRAAAPAHAPDSLSA